MSWNSSTTFQPARIVVLGVTRRDAATYRLRKVLLCYGVIYAVKTTKSGFRKGQKVIARYEGHVRGEGTEGTVVKTYGETVWVYFPSEIPGQEMVYKMHCDLVKEINRR